MERRTGAFVLVAAAILFLLPCTGALGLKFHSDMSSIKVDAQTGQQITRAFRLTLDKSEQRTQFKAHLEDWWRSEDGKQSFYKAPGTLKHSCANWIKLNPVESSVNPGDTLTVRISAAVPNDTKPGGYWCALTVDEVADPNKIVPQGVGVVFTASVSIGIFINVTSVDRSAKILQLSTDGVATSLKVGNDGNCPLGIEGRVEYYSLGDLTKPVASVKMTRSTVLPEPINTSIISVPLPSPAALPSGKYMVRAVLDIGLAHYIGAQKQMDIIHATASTQPDSQTKK